MKDKKNVRYDKLRHPKGIGLKVGKEAVKLKMARVIIL